MTDTTRVSKCHSMAKSGYIPRRNRNYSFKDYLSLSDKFDSCPVIKDLNPGNPTFRSHEDEVHVVDEKVFSSSLLIDDDIKYICDHPGFPNLDISFFRKYGSEEFAYALYRFEQRLRLYDVSAKRLGISPVYNIGEIWYRSLSERQRFAEQLKKERFFSFQDSIGINGSYETSEYSNEKYTGYASLISESALFPWEDDDDEDWRYCITAAPTISDSDLLKFKDALNECLPDINIIPIDKFNVISKFSISSCYDDSYQLKVQNRDRFYRDIEQDLEKTTPYKFLRNLVQVSPANARDTFQVDIADLSRINRGNLIYAQIARSMRNSAEGDTEAYRKATAFLRDHSGRKLFYMIDIKKCGLTVPHVLLEAIADCCIAKYGDIPGLDYPKYFRNASVQVNSDIYTLKRGTGLGYGNELVTILCCTISKLVEQICPYACIFNDDSVYAANLNEKYGFSDDYDSVINSVINYKMNYLINTYESLGLTINRKKSFASRCAVFMEHYFGDFSRYCVNMSKAQLSLMPISKAISASCILEAKITMNSLAFLQTEETMDIFLEELHKVQTKFGYEFSPKEVLYPYIAGGWITPLENNIPQSLVQIEDEDDDQFLFIRIMNEIGCPRFPFFIKDRESKREEVSAYIARYLLDVPDESCMRDTWDYSINDLKDQLVEHVFGAVALKDKGRYKRGTYLYLQKSRQNRFKYIEKSRALDYGLSEALIENPSLLEGEAIPFCIVSKLKKIDKICRAEPKAIRARHVYNHNSFSVWKEINRDLLQVNRNEISDVKYISFILPQTARVYRSLYMPCYDDITELKCLPTVYEYISQNPLGYIQEFFERTGYVIEELLHLDEKIGQNVYKAPIEPHSDPWIVVERSSEGRSISMKVPLWVLKYSITFELLDALDLCRKCLSVTLDEHDIEEAIKISGRENPEETEVKVSDKVDSWGNQEFWYITDDQILALGGTLDKTKWGGKSRDDYIRPLKYAYDLNRDFDINAYIKDIASRYDSMMYTAEHEAPLVQVVQLENQEEAEYGTSIFGDEDDWDEYYEDDIQREDGISEAMSGPSHIFEETGLFQ